MLNEWKHKTKLRFRKQSIDDIDQFFLVNFSDACGWQSRNWPTNVSQLSHIQSAIQIMLIMRPLTHTVTLKHIHTHTRLTAICPGLSRWAGTRKVKQIWILLKQETVSGSGISCAMCKSAPRSRQITTPASNHSVFYRLGALPVAQLTVSNHTVINKWALSGWLFCRLQGYAGSKTLHQQNPPVLNWRCGLMQVDLYSGRKWLLLRCCCRADFYSR